MADRQLQLRSGDLVDGATWFRIADPSWADPLDSTHAAARGGRWNPPDSWNTLYLNADVVTARLNLQLFTAAFPYEPEDLLPDRAPVLVSCRLPRRQAAADVHTPTGVTAAGLPPTYPLDGDGAVVEHAATQPVGERAHDAGLRGVHCRSATSPLGEGRELAWFPATSRSRARLLERLHFDDWYW